mmetsp:Transcript_130158/g.236502  ORF Transcript_130158/g.236502 Transcript_130158/m.236502 type:complete len:364 (-) Transcript_130158:4-1095(-)
MRTGALAALLAFCFSLLTSALPQKSKASATGVLHAPTRVDSQSAGEAPALPVTVFVVTTPDQEHLAMTRNLLCSMGSFPANAAGRRKAVVMLHRGQSTSALNAEQLRRSLVKLGHSEVSVLDSERVFGSHVLWPHLKAAFPSVVRVFGVRHLLAELPPGSRLLAVDADVLCSSERAVMGIPEEVVRRSPSDVAVTCAHEIPGVSEAYNNGFCLYRSSKTADALLAAVEARMAASKFKGDQTSFNQVVGNAAGPALLAAAQQSQFAATFSAGVIGYLHTWSADGFPDARADDLFVVDSAKPEDGMPWSPSDRKRPVPQRNSSQSTLVPLCLHYLPFSPGTAMWSKLEARCAVSTERTPQLLRKQ